MSVPYALNAICTSGNAKFSNDDLRNVIYYLPTRLVKQIYDTFTYSADAFSRKVAVFSQIFYDITASSNAHKHISYTNKKGFSAIDLWNKSHPVAN